MRHRNYGGKLGRTSAHRKALLRNLVTALLDHERIETTDAKARELKRVADRMITLGKRGDLHARRQALAVIRSREVTAKVFGDLAERFRARPGGYTRTLKVRVRPGDCAPLSIVELVGAEAASGAKKSGGTAASKAPAKAAKGEAGRGGRKKTAAGSA
ncbi:50S ribosomal protein L17 [Myxococcaceae bacterium]|jgi:large subunit ribosomal protein L17|nr:50S ribosomal protein L17 [Myxococcaceae bacterium]